MLDELDIRILSLLVEDSRMSYREIARRLGVSPATVVVRVRRLVEAGVIRRFTLDIGYDAAGLGYVMLVLVRCQPRAIRRVVREILGIKGVIYVHEVAGEYHLAVYVVASSQKMLAEIIDSIHGVEGVEDTRSMYVLRSYRGDMVAPLRVLLGE